MVPRAQDLRTSRDVRCSASVLPTGARAADLSTRGAAMTDDRHDHPRTTRALELGAVLALQAGLGWGLARGVRAATRIETSALRGRRRKVAGTR